jgi:hypothetical protein
LVPVTRTTRRSFGEACAIAVTALTSMSRLGAMLAA